MAMALGVTASAYAANPFNDVPQGHWAYDSIQKLADNGIIDGYGDTTFGGDRLMIRYEMAQIVAKAMAKGANVDKLAAEFADELETLGVRVANLEKRTDNVRITAEIRASYTDAITKSQAAVFTLEATPIDSGGGLIVRPLEGGDGNLPPIPSIQGGGSVLSITPIPIEGDLRPIIRPGGNDQDPPPSIEIIGLPRNNARQKITNGMLRTRIYINGAINDDWTYTGRLENAQIFNSNYDDYGAAGEDDLSLNQAYVSGKLGGVRVDAGRQSFINEDMLDVPGDGIKLTYGKSTKLSAWALKVSNNDRIYVVGVTDKVGAVNAAVRYYKPDIYGSNYGFRATDSIWEIALDGKIAKDLTLRGSYFYGTTDFDTVSDMFEKPDRDGWLVGLAYGGAKAAKPGSWGIYTNYSDRSYNNTIAPTIFTEYAVQPMVILSGYKGWELGVNYTLAKNIVAAVKYFDFDAKPYYRGASADARTLWSEVVFTF